MADVNEADAIDAYWVHLDATPEQKAAASAKHLAKVRKLTAEVGRWVAQQMHRKFPGQRYRILTVNPEAFTFSMRGKTYSQAIPATVDDQGKVQREFGEFPVEISASTGMPLRSERQPQRNAALGYHYFGALGEGEPPLVNALAHDTKGERRDDHGRWTQGPAGTQAKKGENQREMMARLIVEGKSDAEIKAAFVARFKEQYGDQPLDMAFVERRLKVFRKRVRNMPAVKAALLGHTNPPPAAKHAEPHEVPEVDAWAYQQQPALKNTTLVPFKPMTTDKINQGFGSAEDPEQVAKWKVQIQKDPRSIPPVVLVPPNGVSHPSVGPQHFIVDGNHRYEAAKQLGVLDKIPYVLAQPKAGFHWSGTWLEQDAAPKLTGVEATVAAIKAGQGFSGQALSSKWQESFKIAAELEPHLRAYGMAYLGPEIMGLHEKAHAAYLAAINTAATSKGGGLGGLSNSMQASIKAGTDAAVATRQATAEMGFELLAKAVGHEGAHERRAAFVAAVLAKTRMGVPEKGKGIKEGVGVTSDHSESQDLRTVAGRVFDAWGVLAEAALTRLPKIYRVPNANRAYNSDLSHMTYTDSEAFAHELAHSVEHAVGHPDGSAASCARSYWYQRVVARGKGEGKVPITPGIKSELGWPDNWANPYMGRDYSGGGGSEVVSMLSEGYGPQSLNVWRSQFKKDSTTLAEFVGYSKAAIEGEMHRLGLKGH